MAANFEILGINSLDIPITDDLKCMRTVNTDAEIIVNEIIRDIFDNAVRKSEEGQQKVLNEKTYTENTDTNTSELIDLTRNYKQEFRILLQNLKSNKTTSGNSSLEDQIKKVIDEIKCLETSIRLSLDDGRGDPEVIQHVNLNPVECKAEITDLVKCEKPPQHIYVNDNESEEIVLQVVDLEDDTVDFSNNFPSDDELEDVTLSLNDLDRPYTARSSQLSRMNDDEIIVLESGSNTDDPSIKNDEKKKTLGKRIWNIITKRQLSVSSLFKKKENVE